MEVKEIETATPSQSLEWVNLGPEDAEFMMNFSEEERKKCVRKVGFTRIFPDKLYRCLQNNLSRSTSV
jgi:hypothetical protein